MRSFWASIIFAVNLLCNQLENRQKKTSANSIDTATAENATGAAAGPIAEGPMAKATGEMSKVEYKGRDLQWSYDMAYTQCMYAKGNRVPGYPIRPEVAPPREAPKK
ncbi:MAG: hypothetical protein ACXVCE_15580 [Bacteriovorax sp.]